ncbi:MAG TPA: VanZ family protein [Methylomirabilota bacterium]|nr:VanZ family protein [Methylomirabilota bacterium]
MRAARFVLPLAWTGIIFWVAGADWSVDSTREFALPLLHRLLPWASPDVLDLAHLLLRKSGHVVGYAVLGALWWGALRRWHAAVLVAALIAFLDEARQAFALERGASAADVLLDTASAGLAVGLRAAGVAPTVDAVTGVLLWTAALLGTALLLLDVAAGAPAGWLWLCAPAAWLVLAWRRRSAA